MCDTVITDEDDTRLIAITDAAADEVRVGLATQGGFDHVFDKGEGRGVSRILEGVENGSTVAVGKIQFARGVGSEIRGYYAIDLGAKRLNCDCGTEISR